MPRLSVTGNAANFPSIFQQGEIIRLIHLYDFGRNHPLGGEHVNRRAFADDMPIGNKIAVIRDEETAASAFRSRCSISLAFNPAVC